MQLTYVRWMFLISSSLVGLNGHFRMSIALALCWMIIGIYQVRTGQL